MSAEQHEVTAPVAAAAGTELSLPERAVAAMKLQVTAVQLTELAAKTADIKSITNADGRKQAHAAAMVLADQRIAIDKAGKAAREDANKFAKQVIVEKDRLIALIEPEEKRLLRLRDEWDAKIEADRKAKAEAERRRVDAIRADIENDLRAPATAMIGRSAADIEICIRDVVAIEITAERFAEFSDTAASVKEFTLGKLRDIHARQLAQEAEHERLRLERAELERQRLANEEAARNERERIAAEEAEAKRQREAEAAAAAVERQRKLDEEMAKLRAQREENERAAKVERERLAEERRQQEAAAAERQRAEQQRLEAERASAAEERERLAEQQRKLESDRAELERQQQQIAATQQTQPAAPVHGPAESAEVETVAAPVAAKEFVPSRIDLVALVANEYGRSQQVAEQWLVAVFGAAA